MTERTRRKLEGVCVYPSCSHDASDDNVLCRDHAADLRDRVRRSLSATRAARRAAGQCVACGEVSDTYRCLACARRGRGSSGLLAPALQREAVQR